MPDIMKRNLSYKLISILLAFILWAYVTNEQNPLTKHTYDIPVEIKGLKSGLVVVDMPKTIKVTLQTGKLSFSTLAPGDIHAYVDLTDITHIGEVIRPVQISKDSDINIIESKPDNIKVNIDNISSKTFYISLKPIGKVDSQYFISNSRISPERISITGPQTLLDKISSVIVFPEINNLKGQQEFNLPVRILDNQGKDVPIDNLKLSNQRVQVNFQVDKNVIEIEKPIKPQIIGQAAEGYYIESIDIYPKMAILSGELFELNKINTIETEKVNISGKSKDFITYINLQTPDKTTIKGNKKIRLTLRIKPINIEKAVQEKIVVKNIPPGLSAKLSTEEVNLLLTGPEKELRNIEISPWIDLRDLKPGEYNLKIRASASPNILISNISPQYVKVILQ